MVSEFILWGENTIASHWAVTARDLHFVRFLVVSIRPNPLIFTTKAQGFFFPQPYCSRNAEKANNSAQVFIIHNSFPSVFMVSCNAGGQIPGSIRSILNSALIPVMPCQRTKDDHLFCAKFTPQKFGGFTRGEAGPSAADGFQWAILLESIRGKIERSQ
jgi:hypothetical protein